MGLLIEEKEREIMLLEKALEVAETEEEIMMRQAKEAHERSIRKEKLEKERKEKVLAFFKIFAKRKMTEAEYLSYIKIYDNPETRKGYNIKNFIEGDDGQAKREDETINNQSE